MDRTRSEVVSWDAADCRRLTVDLCVETRGSRDVLRGVFLSHTPETWSLS